MKIKSIAAAVAAVLSLGLAGQAAGATVTSLYGDKDGFGIGMAPDQSFTGFYPALSKNDPADAGTLTDEYLTGDGTWSHTYDLTGLGAVVSVHLELFTYAQGWHGISDVYFDDVLVGQLTDGDNSGAFLVTNWARLDTFDLSAFGPFDGVHSIRIDTASPNDDIWALDYSQLTIVTDGASPVPEPASLGLAGLGLAALGLSRRRRR